MSFIAIIGAGPIAGALAHKLAGRSRVQQIRLIESGGTIARGKALDILQSGPVEGFNSSVTGEDSLHAAAGADVVVLADSSTGEGEYTGETGLTLLRRLLGAGVTSPIVFAGPSQRDVMKRAASELRVPAARLIGAPPFALESALRALCAVVADSSGVDISLTIVGVPPKHAVVAWEEATVSGQPLASMVGAHDIAALSARIPSLWPPGPYALGSAAARIVEAIGSSSRRRYSCFVDAGKGRIVAMPVELGPGGVRRVIEPTLTRLERTALDNALEE